MHVEIKIINPTADVLAVIMSEQKRVKDAEMEAATRIRATPREVDLGDDQSPDVDLGDDQSPVVDENTAKPTGDAADALVAKLDGQFKRAKTVTLKGGAQGKEGDYVDTEDGRKALIVAVYRGRAVVLFEDKSADEMGSSTLTLVPGEEEAPEVVAPVEAVTPRRRRAPEVEEAADPVDPEEAEMLAKAATINPDVLKSILAEFEMSSLVEFADLEGADRSEFIEVIAEAAAE